MNMVVIRILTSISAISASCSFYSYTPHFPSPSPSFLISLYPYCNISGYSGTFQAQNSSHGLLGILSATYPHRPSSMGEGVAGKGQGGANSKIHDKGQQRVSTGPDDDDGYIYVEKFDVMPPVAAIQTLTRNVLSDMGVKPHSQEGDRAGKDARKSNTPWKEVPPSLLYNPYSLQADPSYITPPSMRLYGWGRTDMVPTLTTSVLISGTVTLNRVFKDALQTGKGGEGEALRKYIQSLHRNIASNVNTDESDQHGHKGVQQENSSTDLTDGSLIVGVEISGDHGVSWQLASFQPLYNHNETHASRNANGNNKDSVGSDSRDRLEAVLWSDFEYYLTYRVHIYTNHPTLPSGSTFTTDPYACQADTPWNSPGKKQQQQQQQEEEEEEEEESPLLSINIHNSSSETQNIITAVFMIRLIRADGHYISISSQGVESERYGREGGNLGQYSSNEDASLVLQQVVIPW